MPDLWQQQAVAALRDGGDVVVHAPTGAGKTLIFELWSNHGKPRGQAIYTVPTRALANDKLAEWRARGWNVGIATGDLAENLEAPVLVATLETQKNRLIQGDGPALLVVDEYQMLGDEQRGLNYELAMALAPPQTQLLLLSGSVGNPQDVMKWLRRLGRRVTLIRHEERPVPLEEVNAANLNYHLPSEIHGYWPRFVAKALAENLGPVLIFSPRRNATEALAAELARFLPNPNPLQVTAEQKQIVGDHLARMLRCRVAYHHSGLSYAARAGVIEPLAKAGQLRVVVATMGLAAGINFSLRSVALAAATYRKNYEEHPLKPDEILQMMGRAGRRGIDETGFLLVAANGVRLRDGFPCHLARSGLVDWGALLGVMAAAAAQGREPFAEAVRVQERLFTTKPIALGVEQALKNPKVPCGLATDADRARHIRKRTRQIRNSRDEWENFPALRDMPLKEIRAVMGAWKRDKENGAENPGVASSITPPLPPKEKETTTPPNEPPSASELAPTQQTIAPLPAGEARGEGERELKFRSILSLPPALEKIGSGDLVVLEEVGGDKIYGRGLTVAELLNDDRVLLTKWVRRMLDWNGRQMPNSVWEEKIVPLLEKKFIQQRTPVARFVRHTDKIVAHLRLGELTMKVPVDAHGVALWMPAEREVMPPDCARCELTTVCRNIPPATGVAMLWRRLGLVDASGVPTRRGRIVSSFSHGDGLAIAAALEENNFPINELIYQMANLRGSFRFCGDENRWAGRLAVASQRAYGVQSIPGYLENGVPLEYGAGAEQVIADVHRNPLSKHHWVTERLGAGDIDRAIIEWRSLLRQTTHGAAVEWPRWQELKARAKAILEETESPTATDLPPLEFQQTKRMEHRLVLRRH